MPHKLRLVGFTLGDPISALSRSGVNYQLFPRLSKKCDLVRAYHLDLHGFHKCYAALRYFSFDRGEWGDRPHQNPWAFKVRTKKAERLLVELAEGFDVIY